MEPRGRDAGSPAKRKRTVYDVRFVVDGYEFRRGFDQRGWAEGFVRQLNEGYALGQPFDPHTRRFVDDGGSPTAAEVTVFEHFKRYVAERWMQWEPATRSGAQPPLARACLHLVREGAPTLCVSETLQADAYLRGVAFTIPANGGLPEDQPRWAAWFDTWSLPMTDVTDDHLQQFLAAVQSARLDGTPRQLAPSSVARTRAVVRAAFTHARKRRLIEWDPWDGVLPIPLKDAEAVDPDHVMSPAQVMALAKACGDVADQWAAFIILMGFCGLRIGETVDLRVRDLVRADGTLNRVTPRGSHSAVANRFFYEGEGRRRPLKGRGPKAGRTIPIPRQVTAPVQRHLDAISRRPNSRAFANGAGNPINLSNFYRDVWRPARAKVFGSEDPLRDVTPHDLRHSAITNWLNAGVPLKTVQHWSGHKTLSVLLDIYAGVMSGDDDLARGRVEGLLAAAIEPPFS